MPAVGRLTDKDTGHGCWPPRASTTGSPNVFVNGKAALRVSDQFGPHTCGTNTHSGVITVGSNTVFANGKKLARIADNISCGSVISEGSPNVFAGG